MDFRLARYEFDLIPEEDINLPGYAGSTLRGGFGRAFRNVVCASRERECSECLLRANCVFPRIFDTVPPQGWDMMPNQANAPRPFVIEPPVNGKRVYKPGEVITFGLILVGYVEEYLPYFIYSFEELGRRFGLGRGKGRFRLAEVRSVSLDGGGGGASLLVGPDPAESWKARLLPPARRSDPLRFGLSRSRGVKRRLTRWGRRPPRSITASISSGRCRYSPAKPR